MITTVDDLSQSSGILYGPSVPRLRVHRASVAPGPAVMSGSPKELLELGLEAIRAEGMRTSHLAGNLERLVERYLDGEKLADCMRAPIRVAVALSTPGRPHSSLSTLENSLSFPNCGSCERDMGKDEIHLLDMGVKKGLNRFCLPCIKDENQITEPIEDGDDVAFAWIERRLRELERL